MTSATLRSTVVTVLVSISIACQLRRQFEDFSKKGPEYAPLENLRIMANDLAFSGSEEISVFGKPYASSKYTVAVNVEIQTACLEGVGGVYERVPADFEIYVIEDRDRYLHNKIVQMIYDLWSRNEVFSGKYFFDFTVRNGIHSLAVIPDAVNRAHFYFVWVNNRVVKVVFKGFKGRSQDGWGMMDSFTSENLRLQVAASEFEVYGYRGHQQRKSFLELHRQGFFQR